MAVPFPVRMSQIRNEFGGNGRASEYLRDGALVQTNSSTGNISTQRTGWRFSQFNGAAKSTLPPVPTLQSLNAFDEIFVNNGGGSAAANISLRNDGVVAVYQENAGSYDAYRWLPGGRSAGEYQVRVSNYDQNNFGPWMSLGNTVGICSASAWSDGFYSGNDQLTSFVQIGANGVALTGIVQFDCSANAYGRG
jgi:hypothetical protein